MKLRPNAHAQRPHTPPAVAPRRRPYWTETASRARVLVVDDHADTRDLLAAILTTDGYEVTLADDGDVALQCYRERAADVVLMDLYMPRRNGVATIRDLRAEFPGVVIVAMSGDAGAIWQDALAEARAAGAQLTLRKPIEPWVLLRTFEGLMAARRSA